MLNKSKITFYTIPAVFFIFAVILLIFSYNSSEPVQTDNVNLIFDQIEAAVNEIGFIQTFYQINKYYFFSYKECEVFRFTFILSRLIIFFIIYILSLLIYKNWFQKILTSKITKLLWKIIVFIGMIYFFIDIILFIHQIYNKLKILEIINNLFNISIITKFHFYLSIILVIDLMIGLDSKNDNSQEKIFNIFKNSMNYIMIYILVDFVLRLITGVNFINVLFSKKSIFDYSVFTLIIGYSQIIIAVFQFAAYYLIYNNIYHKKLTLIEKISKQDNRLHLRISLSLKSLYYVVFTPILIYIEWFVFIFKIFFRKTEIKNHFLTGEVIKNKMKLFYCLIVTYIPILFIVYCLLLNHNSLKNKYILILQSVIIVFITFSIAKEKKYNIIKNIVLIASIFAFFILSIFADFQFNIFYIMYLGSLPILIIFLIFSIITYNDIVVPYKESTYEIKISVHKKNSFMLLIIGLTAWFTLIIRFLIYIININLEIKRIIIVIIVGLIFLILILISVLTYYKTFQKKLEAIYNIKK